MPLKFSVIEKEEEKNLSCLNCSHCLKLFGRLFYIRGVYEDAFGWQNVFAKESMSITIRPDTLCPPKEADMDLQAIFFTFCVCFYCFYFFKKSFWLRLKMCKSQC